MITFISIKNYIIQVNTIQRISPLIEGDKEYYFLIYYTSNNTYTEFNFDKDKYDYNKLQLEKDKLSHYLITKKSDNLSFFTNINLKKKFGINYK